MSSLLLPITIILGWSKTFLSSTHYRVYHNVVHVTLESSQKTFKDGHFKFSIVSNLLTFSSTHFLRASQVVPEVKNLPANAGDVRDVGSSPRSGRSPEGGHSNPLQYYCLDSGAWREITKSWTWLNWLSTHACTYLLTYLSCKMKVKEESEKAGLKLNIQKTKIMASGPITWWEIDGEIMETVSDFFGEGRGWLQNHLRWFQPGN